MKKKYLSIFVLSVLSLLLLAGCATGPNAQSTPGMTANDDYLFITAANKIYQIDLKTGQEVWRYPKNNARMMSYAPVLLMDDDFTYGDMYNTLQRVKIETLNQNQNPNNTENENNADKPMQILWQFTGAKGWYQAKVAETDGIIIAPNTDRNIYAVDAANGNLLWVHEDAYAFLAEPLIIDNTVVISSQDHEILWLDLKTGEEIAEPVKMNGAVIAKPFYLEETGLIYIGSLGNEFVAIDAQNHTIKWTFSDPEIKLSGVWAPPIYIDNQIIFNDDKGNIVSINPEDGKKNWSLAEQGQMLAGLASIENDRFVIASENGEIRVFTLENGQPVRPFSFEIDKAQIFTTPMVAGDYLFITTMGSENLVYAYEFSGKVAWTFKPSR